MNGFEQGITRIEGKTLREKLPRCVGGAHELPVALRNPLRGPKFMHETGSGNMSVMRRIAAISGFQIFRKGGKRRERFPNQARKRQRWRLEHLVEVRNEVVTIDPIPRPVAASGVKMLTIRIFVTVVLLNF